MEVKLFEVRDIHTFIPVLAVKLDPTCKAEQYLLGRTGYGTTPKKQGGYVMLSQLAGGKGRASADPYNWGSTRTMAVAHNHINQNWGLLATGSVIDVEFILGESPVSKRSESEIGQ